MRRPPVALPADPALPAVQPSWICSTASGGSFASTSWRARHPRRRGAVGRVGFGRAGAYPPRARRGRRAAARPGSRTSTISCATPRIATSGSARRSPRRSGCRSCVERDDVARARAARAAFDRGRGAHGAPRVLRAGARRISAPTSSRSATRATIRPRRSCCGCCAARGRGAWRRCIRGTARSSARCSYCRRAELRAYLAERRRRVRRGRVERRRQHSAQPGPRRAAAAARGAVQPGVVDVLADEAELARETWQWMEAEADELRLRVSGRGARPARRPAPVRIDRRDVATRRRR